MQFSSDVAVFGRRCQFEILILPEIKVSRKTGVLWIIISWTYEGYVVSSAENYCREQRFENFAMSFDLLLKEVADLLINQDRFSCHISQKIAHRNQ